MEIALIRHAEEGPNGLSKEGVRQSESIGRLLFRHRDKVTACIFSSGAPQVLATAQRVGQELYLRHVDIKEPLGSGIDEIIPFIDEEILKEQEAEARALFLLFTHEPHVRKGAKYLAGKIQATSFKDQEVGNAEGWLFDMEHGGFEYIRPEALQAQAPQTPTKRASSLVAGTAKTPKSAFGFASFLKLFKLRTS